MSSGSPSEFEKLTEIHPDNKDETIATLETEVQTLKDSLDETRFWAIFISTILLNGILFLHMPVYGIISISVFEAVGLFAAAKRLRIEKAVEIGEKLFDGICRRLFGKEHDKAKES